MKFDPLKFDPLNNHRILLIDDSESVHGLFRKMLGTSSVPPTRNERKAAPGQPEEKFEKPVFEIDSAFQGEEGLALIEKSLLEKRPYALAFVDVRMEPGWDGIQTTCKIWDTYPDLQVVICTGFVDRPWEDMVKTLGFLDRVVVLMKPFEKIEVIQLAVGMTEKWRLNQQAKLRVDNLEKLVENARARDRADKRTNLESRPR
jgi:CheY-like chemotaxis protein